MNSNNQANISRISTKLLALKRNQLKNEIMLLVESISRIHPVESKGKPEGESEREREESEINRKITIKSRRTKCLLLLTTHSLIEMQIVCHRMTVANERFWLKSILNSKCALEIKYRRMKKTQQNCESSQITDMFVQCVLLTSGKVGEWMHLKAA